MIVVPVAPTRIPKTCEPPADRAAVGGAERREQAEGRHDQAGAERAHVDERAPRDHQRADDDKGDGCDVGGGADRRREAVGDPAPDHAPAPAEIENRGEEEAEGEQP